jgi:DNA-binding transcriptional LysR family regulator
MWSESMIEVRQARYFLAVAEELHFGRAANRLNMSQPPLSQAIRQLERELGVRLLERTSRSVTLTDTGRVFADECRRLIGAARRAEDIAAQAEAGLYGTLRIGAVTLAFAETLPRIIARFRASRPGVRLNVEEIDTPKGRDGLLNHEIDVAIIRLGEPVRHLRTRPLRRDQLVIATPSDYPRVPDSTDAIDLSTLRDEPWVWLRRDVSPDYHDQLLTACREAGFTPDAHCHANSITTQLAMVASGLGITLVPNAAIRFGQPDIRHRPLLNPFELVELSLVSRDTTREPLVDHFIECATTEPP